MQQERNEYQAMMEEAEREATQASADWSPVPCPRSFGQRCYLCEQVGIHWNARYEGYRAGERSDYDRIKGILYTKGNSKELRRFARLWRADRAFYSPLVIVPNFQDIKIARYTTQVFEPLNMAEFGPADKPKAQFKGFWHPTQGRIVYVTKNSQDPQNYYTVDFAVQPNAIPNPQAVLQMVQNFIPNLQNIVTTELEGTIELFQFKSIKDGSTVQVRFLPWNGAHPRLFYRDAYWHSVPYKDRMEEAGVEISKDEIEAAISGQLNIMDVIQGSGLRPVMSRTSQPSVGATSVPMTGGAPPSLQTEIPPVQGPNAGTPPPSTTPFQLNTPAMRTGPQRIPPELNPSAAGAPEDTTPDNLDIGSLLNQVQPEPDAPTYPQGTPVVHPSPGPEIEVPPESPAEWPCFGRKFDQNDPSCVGDQRQAQCPKVQDCVNAMRASAQGTPIPEDDIPF